MDCRDTRRQGDRAGRPDRKASLALPRLGRSEMGAGTNSPTHDPHLGEPGNNGRLGKPACEARDTDDARRSDTTLRGVTAPAAEGFLASPPAAAPGRRPRSHAAHAGHRPQGGARDQRHIPQGVADPGPGSQSAPGPRLPLTGQRAVLPLILADSSGPISAAQVQLYAMWTGQLLAQCLADDAESLLVEHFGRHGAPRGRRRGLQGCRVPSLAMSFSPATS